MALSRYERKRRLGHGGVTLVKQRTGYALSYVSQVVHGTRRNRKIEVAIARHLNLPVNKVFSERRRKAKQRAA